MSWVDRISRFLFGWITQGTMAEANEQIRRLDAVMLRLKAREEKWVAWLRENGQHTRDCAKRKGGLYRGGPDIRCDCGLDEILGNDRPPPTSIPGPGVPRSG